MPKRFAAIILIGALGLASSAASCGGSVKDSVGKAIVAAEAAYHVVAEAELALRCGQPTAPAAPLCITPEKHAGFKALLLQVYNPGPPPVGYLVDAKSLYVLLPAEGTPSTSQIFAIIAQIGEIVQRVIAGLPQSATASAAASNSDVVSTMKQVK